MGLGMINVHQLWSWIQEAQTVTGIPFDLCKDRAGGGAHQQKPGGVRCPIYGAVGTRRTTSGEADRSGREPAMMPS